LVKIFLTVHHLQTKYVAVKTDCCVQVRNRDSDMIKTEQTRQQSS
jgi:hypothetical protein